MSFHWNGSEVSAIRYEDVDIELIGLDVETGAEAWTLALGDAGMEGAPNEHHAPQFLAAEDRVVTMIDGRATIADVSTGATRELKGSEAVFCAGKPEPVDVESIWPTGQHTAARSYALCDADGEADPDALPSTAAIVLAGYEAGESAAVNTTEGLRLYITAAM